MHIKHLRFFFPLLLLAALFPPALHAQAVPAASVGPGDLILAMNTLRVSNGLPALIEDPIIDAVAQATAETMAANEMSWHIGNVSGRVQAAGYGGGATVWATENFAVGYNQTIDQIMIIWSDPSHMLPAVTAAYCNIGAGTAKAANGATYYILQAAYVAGKSCGSYTSSGGSRAAGTKVGPPPVSQVIIPVKVATPDADGRLYHIVQPGQSFWAIAIAYKVTIQDILKWNNLPSSTSLQVGEKLFIPSGSTVGYATPTPPGMVQISTPAADGTVIHTVQAYQTLSSISAAYGVSLDTILALNGLQVDWPLSIGQQLIIHPSNVTPSPTPRPLTPIERLTPGSDGKYYHTVASGESLSSIAQLYGVRLTDLMAWNGLDGTAVLQPGKKLVLQVTPPATLTPTRGPETATPTPTLETPSITPSPSATPVAVTATPSPAPPPSGPASSSWWLPAGIVAVLLVASGVLLSRVRINKKPPA